MTPRKTSMTAELQQQQPMSPMSPGRPTFYRPMSERMIDKSAERRLSDLEGDRPSGVITDTVDQFIVSLTNSQDQVILPGYS